MIDELIYTYMCLSLCNFWLILIKSRRIEGLTTYVVVYERNTTAGLNFQDLLERMQMWFINLKRRF